MFPPGHEQQHGSFSITAHRPGKVARQPARSARPSVIERVDETAEPPPPLARADLPADTLALARRLIGATVVRVTEHGLLSGRIVETEAYSPGDPAGHAFRGITPRNKTLFRERGHAYVYLAYGISFMLNVSAEAEGVGAGVLIRAIEPRQGIPIMERNRGPVPRRDLARGPGRLCLAFAIDRTLDGLDLCAAGPLYLAPGAEPPPAIGQSPRIGITRAADWPHRFYARGSPFVSGPKSLSLP